MKTKPCKLVFSPNKRTEIKQGDFVEYMVYNINRTTSKFIGKIETCVGKNFIKLGNGEFYNEKDLKPVSPFLFSDETLIADETQFALIKDAHRFPNSCAIPVPINTIEINEIMENGGQCYIELIDLDDLEELSGNTSSEIICQNDTPKTINNKIIIVL